MQNWNSEFLRKGFHFNSIEEGLSHYLALKTLRTIADHESYWSSKLTNIQQQISLNDFIGSKIISLVWIQVYVLLIKIHLVPKTQKCPLRMEKQAFVKADLANFWCADSRKIFPCDSDFVYFSTLCVVISQLFWH